MHRNRIQRDNLIRTNLLTGQPSDTILHANAGNVVRPKRNRRLHDPNDVYARQYATAPTDENPNPAPNRKRPNPTKEERELTKVLRKEASVLRAFQKKAKRKLDRVASSKVNLLKQFGRILVDGMEKENLKDWDEETDEQTARREAGQARSLEFQHLVGRRFLHPISDSLYEITYVFWDSRSDKIAGYRRACDVEIETNDRYPYAIEGARGMARYVTAFEECAGIADTERKWPQSEAEMLAAQLEDPAARQFIDRIRAGEGEILVYGNKKRIYACQDRCRRESSRWGSESRRCEHGAKVIRIESVATRVSVKTLSTFLPRGDGTYRVKQNERINRPETLCKLPTM